MKDYLKMADVFVGEYKPKRRIDAWPPSRYGETLVELSGSPAQYAVHAINSHDELVAEVERLRSTLQQCVGALYIAHKFCGNHTADECGDEIAIPISDALVAASKIVAPSNLGVTND